MDRSKREFRLIQLSLDEHDVAYCRLSTHSIDEAPPFAALSYVWGDVSITQDVFVNGSVFHATVNLAQALIYAEAAWEAAVADRDSSTMRIWVDAICINQEDIEERNSQVAMMADIYEGAEAVLSWLGEGSPELDKGLHAFGEVATAIEWWSTEDIACLEWMEDSPSLCDPSPVERHEEGNEVFYRGNRTWEAMRKVFELLYWSRVWIFQELSLAKELMFFTSDTAIHVNVILQAEKALSVITNIVQRPRIVWPEFVSESVRAHMCSQFWNWTALERLLAGRDRAARVHETKDAVIEEVTAWTLSFYGRRMLATNPKDHGYGLLALTRLNLTPDYSPSTTIGQVYGDFVARLIDFHANNRHPSIEPHELFFLEWAGSGLYKNNLGLPTWAPNFPEESIHNLAGPSIDANADDDVFPEGTTIAFVQDLVLNVSGTKIDTIEHIDDAPGESSWYDGTMLAFMKQIVLPTSRYPKPLKTIVTMIRLQHDTSQLPLDHLFYALHFLEFMLLTAGSETLQHLHDLGISWDDFDNAFPKAFSDRADEAFHPWKRGFLTQDEARRAEFHAELIDVVASDLTMLRKRWQFFLSLDGYLGFCPPKTLPTDEVYILKGCGTPVILRTVDNHCEFVGTCFMPDSINAEAKTFLECKKREVQSLCLH